MWQVDHGVRGAAVPAVERSDHEREHPFRRRRRDRDVGEGAPSVSGWPRVDGLSGPHRSVEPVDQDRSPGGRVLRAHRAVETRSRSVHLRSAHPGPHRRPPKRDGPLPPPALGRHAPAGCHRDGTCIVTGAPHPRRADNRSRRNRGSRGPRPDPRPAPGDRRRGAVDRSQPGRHSHDVRPRRCDVCRAHHRRGSGTRGLRQSQAPVHDRPPERDPPKRAAQDRPGALDHPRQPPRHRNRSSRPACTSTGANWPTKPAEPRCRNGRCNRQGIACGATTSIASTS